MDVSQRYLACVFGTCGTACAFCTRVQPGSGIGVSLRSVEYSPFLVGVEWRRVLTFSSLAATLRRRHSAHRYRIGVTTCWSWKEESCTLQCGPEEPVTLSGPAGSFSVPADLYSGSVQLRVRGLGRDRPGAAVFRAHFRRKELELFLYTEMLVVFLLAGALTLVALLTIGFILMRALGLTTFLDVEPNEMAAGPGGARESQAQGDHRRHVPGVARRRRAAAAAALPRVRSRGDS
ncbi:hypothetical protein HPB52_023829 [Rhipicephalus sanguineus]|uniref:Uncharacterized protein n=1 Tax=Rhipicephalus sanguineus TaxID=34632 RepID=A0A9D4SV29_RHISA|nr:hypothetical protein HPB52_023829 [Rhipicephalus sanguineus]